INIIDPLARIRGVGQASLFGPLDYSLRLWLDPDRLTAFNLTPADVVAAVQSQNVQAALGRIGAAPSPQAQQLQLTITTEGRLTRTDEFENIILRANPGGSVVRVKDVARVDLGAKTQDRYSRFNGTPAAAIGIYQSPGANAVEVARHVRETLDQLQQRFPDDVAYATFWDATIFVTSTVEEVVRTLVIAFVPVAFIPGISGQLFRQFAVAVSTSMVISAINALTLSPALCSVLLSRATARRRGPMNYVLGAIDRVRNGYVAVVRRLLRVAVF